jgi:hypothetical protein
LTIYGQKTGKTLYSLSRPIPAAVDGPVALAEDHGHIAIVDCYGDGWTSNDKEHRHKIREGVIEIVLGHCHKRVMVDEAEQAA